MDRPVNPDGRCPLCGEPLHDADRCSRCDWVRGYRQRERSLSEPHPPRDVVAAALSIVPGAGHIFKGYRLAGWLLMLLGVPVVFIFAYTFTMFFGWLLVPTYWVVVGVDAYLREDLRHPNGIGAAHSS